MFIGLKLALQFAAFIAKGSSISATGPSSSCRGPQRAGQRELDDLDEMKMTNELQDELLTKSQMFGVRFGVTGFARPQLRAFIMVGAICFTPVFIGLPSAWHSLLARLKPIWHRRFRIRRCFLHVFVPFCTSNSEATAISTAWQNQQKYLFVT